MISVAGAESVTHFIDLNGPYPTQIEAVWSCLGYCVVVLM